MRIKNVKPIDILPFYGIDEDYLFRDDDPEKGRSMYAMIEEMKTHGYQREPIPVIRLTEPLLSTPYMKESKRNGEYTGQKYLASDGTHRHYAAIKAGVKEVSVVIYGPGDNMEEVRKISGGDAILDYNAFVEVLS